MDELALTNASLMAAMIELLEEKGVVRRISVSGEAGRGGQNPHIDSAGRPKRAYYQLKDVRAIFA